MGGEVDIDRHRRGAQRIGLVARGRGRRRRAGRAARLAEDPGRVRSAEAQRAAARAECRPAQPRNARRASAMAGEQHAAPAGALPLHGGSCRRARRTRRSCCSAMPRPPKTSPQASRSAAKHGNSPSACWPRSRFRPIRPTAPHCPASTSPGARMTARRPRSLRRDRPASHPAGEAEAPAAVRRRPVAGAARQAAAAGARPCPQDRGRADGRDLPSPRT